MLRTEVLIVGAGLSGILLGCALKDLKTILAEKSRGTGGRMATRRIGGLFFDYGVREFSPVSELMKTLVQEAESGGFLKASEHGFKSSQGFSAWAKDLATDLEIIKEAEVKKLQRGTSWQVVFADGSLCEAQVVVLSCPAPQAAVILENSELSWGKLKTVAYASEIVLFYTSPLEGVEAKFDARFSSPLSAGGVFWRTLKQEFHAPFLDSTKEQLTDKFFQELNLKPGDFGDFHLHKWKYSRPINFLTAEDQLLHKEKKIFLCGDYFFGDDLNAAAASAESIGAVIRDEFRSLPSRQRRS